MRSPLIAILWENWRVTRAEAVQRLAMGIVGGAAVLAWFGAGSSSDGARASGAATALGLLILMNFPMWLSIARLKGGRFIDGYHAGFPLSLLYIRPVRTAALVALPMAYQAALAAAVYLASALVLGLAFGYSFPLLSVAAGLAAAQLGQQAGDWSSRSKVIQWLGTMAPVAVIGLLTRARWGGPALLAFSPGDYAVIAAVAVTAVGVAVAGVARQRRGDARVARPRTGLSPGFPERLVTFFRFPCPASSATRAQVWLDLRSTGVPVLVIGLALALIIPLLFVVTTRLDLVLSRFYDEPATRAFAAIVAMFAVPAVLVLGGNAFGVRGRQGRVQASVFEATQAFGTARMAGIKVLVRSACLLAALLAVGASAWTSASVIPFDVLHDNDTLIEKSRSPLSALMRLMTGRAGAASADELLAFIFVSVIVAMVMVGARASLAALRARYPRRVTLAGAVMLLHGLVLVLLTVATRRGFGVEALSTAVIGATPWLAAAAMVLVTMYLCWASLSERLVTWRQVLGAALVSGAFAAAWLVLMHAANVQLSAMAAADVVWVLLPAGMPLMVGVLAPWSLSRIRHT